MTFLQLRFLVRSDLYRYEGNVNLWAFITTYLTQPGFHFTFWMRFGEYLHDKPLWRYSVYPFVKWMHRRLTIRYGISIPIGTEIGPGLYIGHFGGIVVNGKAKIGRDCNLSQGVTIGQINRGRRQGVPVIGDAVYIAPGAKVIGNIHVGHHVAIGANAVVIDDVPDFAACVGIPARVIPDMGVEGYVEYTGYMGPQSTEEEAACASKER